MDQQMILKERFMGMGYIDTSESVNRNGRKDELLGRLEPIAV